MFNILIYSITVVIYDFLSAFKTLKPFISNWFISEDADTDPFIVIQSVLWNFHIPVAGGGSDTEVSSKKVARFANDSTNTSVFNAIVKIWPSTYNTLFGGA
jgi:hypothetical protein